MSDVMPTIAVMPMTTPRMVSPARSLLARSRWPIEQQYRELKD
jgi:hypothetical protein